MGHFVGTQQLEIFFLIFNVNIGSIKNEKMFGGKPRYQFIKGDKKYDLNHFYDTE